MTADISYSKGVQYRAVDWHRSPISTTLPPPLPLALPHSSDDATYCTLHSLFPTATAATSATLSLPATMGSHAEAANTRHLHAVAEVTVSWSTAPRALATEVEECVLEEGVQVGRLHIQGQLAQGSRYAFDVPPSAENLYLGRKVSCAWCTADVLLQ